MHALVRYAVPPAAPLKAALAVTLLVLLTVCGCRSHAPAPPVVPQGMVEFDGALSAKVAGIRAYVDGQLAATTDGLTFPALTVSTGQHTIRLEALDAQGQVLPNGTFETQVAVGINQTVILKTGF
jgi:hypothetical protein